MQIQDCLPYMSTLYLSRIVDSIIKEDLPKGDENRLREQITQNLSEISNPDRVKNSLKMEKISRDHRLLYESILTSLLEEPNMACKSDELFYKIREYEEQIINESQSEGALNYSDPYSIDVFKTILQVALEDKDISNREFVLLKKLRWKLQVNRHEQRLLEAQLSMYPKPGNQLHSNKEFDYALKELQSKGVVFFCNKHPDGNLVVLPEEMKPMVKETLEIELREEAYKSLLNQLSSKQIVIILKHFELPVSGAKDERIDRVLKAGIQPSEGLNVLSNDELVELCRKLKGVQVGRTKAERIDSLINYFASLSNKEPQTSEDKREVYYQYFEELAARNNKELYGKKIIQKDLDMDRYFEQATHYLFEEKLSLKPDILEGKEHADGKITLNNGEVILWDNKSKEGVYKFPQSHFKQFRRYIRESAQRVNTFLIIVSEVDTQKAEEQALKLKWESESDTDIAIIRAADLKYMAENWPNFASKKNNGFNPKVFNITGILERNTLEKYMKLVG